MPTGSANASGIKLQNPPKPPNPNPNPNPDPMPSGEAAAIHQPQFLSREEVLRRRSHRAKKLARVYRRHYWAMIEEIRVKHRDYYWEFGKSPLEEEEENEEEENEEGERKRCGNSGCKSKAMPLTTYCHQHILSDKKQTLYKGCAFVTKRYEIFNFFCRILCRF